MSGPTSDKAIGDKPGAGTPSSADTPAPTARATTAPQSAAASSSIAPAASATQGTLICPKCGADVREVARFCQRCHHTMRYECPSCHHEQRTGGKCEKCGIDFLKYIGAVIAQKQVESEAMRDRLEKRSTLVKNLMWLPFTLGFPIIRDYFLKRDRKK
jgi:hypothetical protein